MPWNKSEPMNERIKSIGAYFEQSKTFSDVCVDYKIIRKTGNKWVEYDLKGGVIGLAVQLKAPSFPQKFVEITSAPVLKFLMRYKCSCEFLIYSHSALKESLSQPSPSVECETIVH